jgi:hypothetical protein
MITKKSTVFFVFLSCAVGAWLFCLKYSVITLEDRIRIAKSELIEEQKNRHILRAEWKSLTTPERVQELALRHLDMRQTDPDQLREFDPSIFHSEKNKTKRIKKLSKLVDEILAQNPEIGGL